MLDGLRTAIARTIAPRQTAIMASLHEAIEDAADEVEAAWRAEAAASDSPSYADKYHTVADEIVLFRKVVARIVSERYLAETLANPAEASE